MKGDGLNFTERQRIKRKAQRWAAKFAALSAAERIAILNAMGFEGSQPEPSMFRTKSAYERQLSEICGCGHTWADHDDEEDQVCNGIDLFGRMCECNGFHASLGSHALFPNARFRDKKAFPARERGTERHAC